MQRLVQFSTNKNVKFSLVGKNGGDGFGDLKQFRGLQIKQSSVFASVIVPVMVKAEDTVTEKSSVVWVNPRVNSCTAVAPLRYSFEKETDENSLAEFKRMEAEVEALKPFKFDGFGGIEIGFDILPTDLDGKAKGVWAETVGKSSTCPVCDAKPIEMSKRFLKKFTTYPRKRLRFGFSNCHLQQRILHWLVKGCEYRDFKRWSQSSKDGTDILAKNRKLEYQVSFLLCFFLSVFLLLLNLCAHGCPNGPNCPMLSKLSSAVQIVQCCPDCLFISLRERCKL